MNCPRCQTANPEGARFCLNCGNQLEAPGSGGRRTQVRDGTFRRRGRLDRAGRAARSRAVRGDHERRVRLPQRVGQEIRWDGSQAAWRCDPRLFRRAGRTRRRRRTRGTRGSGHPGGRTRIRGRGQAELRGRLRRARRHQHRARGARRRRRRDQDGIHGDGRHHERGRSPAERRRHQVPC